MASVRLPSLLSSKSVASAASRNARNIRIIPQKVIGPCGDGDDGWTLLGLGTEHLCCLVIAQVPASAAADRSVGRVHLLLLAEHAFVVQPIHVAVRDGWSAFAGGDAVTIPT